MASIINVRGNQDVHYCVIPQDRIAPKTFCGADCSEFIPTKDKANCPDCVDLYDCIPDNLADIKLRESPAVPTTVGASDR